MDKATVSAALVTALCISPSVQAAETRNPATRFDDISQTVITPNVSVNGAGHYVYTYAISAPASNTGYITSFWLYAGCSEPVSSAGFDSSVYGKVEDNYSTDGLYVPLAALSPQTPLFETGITHNNYISFIIPLLPGDSIGELTVVSPLPPGNRAYKLIPNGEYRMSSFDYPAEIDEFGELPYPWVDDWTVTGTVQGPACPGEEYKDDEIFAGSVFPGETEELNELLTYSVPLVDQFHVPNDVTSYVIKIHNANDVDIDSFVVTPNNIGLSSSFHPSPGDSEAVTIPLSVGKNIVSLQVKRTIVAGEADNGASETSQAREGVIMDKDAFVIYRDK